MSDIKQTQELIQKMNKVSAIIPENLKKLLSGCDKVYYRGKNLKSDNLIDATSTIIKKYIKDKKNFYSLSSEVHKKKYSTYYNYYIDFLVNYNIIKISQRHLNGSHCTKYSLCEETKNSKFENIFLTDKRLVEKYKKLYSKKKIREKNNKYISERVVNYVIDNLSKVQLSYSDAKEYLEKIQNNLTKCQYHKNLSSINNLKNYFTYISFDNYGRCHTNFTTLKSEIREQFLLINGQKTKTMDISNSQPTFLTVLLSKNKKKIDSKEYELFKNLVINSELYKYIYDNRLIDEIKGDPFNSIPKIKKMVYVVLFGRNRTKTPNKQNKLFRCLFPNIFQFIINYKNNSKDKHKALAYYLQRSESNFLFNKICEEIIDKHPNVPFFTVHDSITVAEKEYGKIKKIFDKHIKILHKEFK
mgnify:CR=1 FL=1